MEHAPAARFPFRADPVFRFSVFGFRFSLLNLRIRWTSGRAHPRLYSTGFSGENLTAPPKKKGVCMLCGKPSLKSICAACADQINSEAVHKKKKEQKGKH
jgi:hypothetical protein